MKISFKNPEDLISYQFVGTSSEYEEMLINLSQYEIVLLDCETVGKSTISLFSEKEMLLQEKFNLLNNRKEDYDQVLELKEIIKNNKNYLKEKYNISKFNLLEIQPDDRAILHKYTVDLKKLEAENKDFTIIYKIDRQIKSLDKKIDDDDSGLKYHKNYLALIQLGTLDYSKQYLIDPNVIDDRFKSYLKSRKAIIGMNLKFDLSQLYYHLNLSFFNDPVVLYDIMLAAKVRYSGKFRTFSLKSLSEILLNYEQSKEERISNWLSRPLASEQLKYASLDVITPGLIFEKLKQELREENLSEIAGLQMDFLKVITKMELNGIYVDLENTNNLIKEVDFLLNKKREELGEKLNDKNLERTKDLRSPKETLEILRMYGNKNNIQELIDLNSTNVNEFDAIEEHIPILEEISKFRSLHHTKATYCESFLKNHIDSRIHSNFIQLQKEGTRMSSREPNVQNLVSPGNWDPDKESFEDALKNWTPAEKVRTLFIPTPGYNLFDADYSQIELCMLAYYSQDPNMVRALLDNVDLHALSANSLFDLGFDYEQFKDKEFLSKFKKKYKKERFVGKTYNFSVGYGAGIKKLLKQLTIAGIYDVNLDLSKVWRDRWYNMFPGIALWQQNQLSFARTYGYVVTRLGRKIYFNDPENEYSKIFNTSIQASCYEGLQRSAVIFSKKVLELETKEILKPNDLRLCNLIHDEFYVEARKHLNEKSVIKLINESMIEGIQPLMEEREIDGYCFSRIPVKVDCSKINRWSDKA